MNVNTGDIAWQVPLGSYDELDKLGVPKTGMPTTNGGGIATAGNLVFIGASTDGKFRAFDSRNGKELWIDDIGVDTNSIPITWQARMASNTLPSLLQVVRTMGRSRALYTPILCPEDSCGWRKNVSTLEDKSLLVVLDLFSRHAGYR